MKYGQYADAEETARKGILAALQDQPTMSVGYLYYLLAMAMDAQRIQARHAHIQFDSDKIQEIITAYQTADELLVNEGRMSVSYRRVIKARLIIIGKEEKISVEIPNEDTQGLAELFKGFKQAEDD